MGIALSDPRDFGTIDAGALTLLRRGQPRLITAYDALHLRGGLVSSDAISRVILVLYSMRSSHFAMG
jgi:hypothetical protein